MACPRLVRGESTRAKGSQRQSSAMAHQGLSNDQAMNDGRMRWSLLVVFGSALIGSSGCTNSILGVLLAPEGVVTGAAGSAAEAGARSLSGASLEELSDVGNTVSELDRILQENPDAVNSERLHDLRNRMEQQTGKNTGPDQRQVAKEPLRPRRASDTPMPLRKGDALTVSPPGDMVVLRRPPSRPETLPLGSALREDPRPVHAMSLKPVRLQ